MKKSILSLILLLSVFSANAQFTMFASFGPMNFYTIKSDGYYCNNKIILIDTNKQIVLKSYGIDSIQVTTTNDDYHDSTYFQKPEEGTNSIMFSISSNSDTIIIWNLPIPESLTMTDTITDIQTSDMIWFGSSSTTNNNIREYRAIGEMINCFNDNNTNLSIDSNVNSKDDSCELSYTFKYSIDSGSSFYDTLTSMDTVWYWWTKNGLNKKTKFDSIQIDSLITGDFQKNDTLYCAGISPYKTDTLMFSFIDDLCKDTVVKVPTSVKPVLSQDFKSYVYNGTLYVSDYNNLKVQVTDLLGRYTIYNMTSNELSLPQEFGIIKIFKNDVPVKTLKFSNVQ